MSFLSVFQSGVNDVVAALQQYQASLVNNLRSQVQKVFQQHHGSGLEKDVLAVFDQIEDPFASVSTTYRQDDVIKRNFNFVESEEVCVGYTAVMGKKGEKKGKKDSSLLCPNVFIMFRLSEVWSSYCPIQEFWH